ncbi:hypothetical protein ANCCAN_02061 [Ancylostoma caninum]|uniref:Uncharacterized protein n=1 Tax=Ancylostoma caninum TaxID=29170 RepID=A0A368H518_ANCCA|nr:hypothetical protein ANCCAN_02061 [Ancylostoma caninum]
MCNKQINRLIASDKFPESALIDGDDEPPVSNAVKDVPRHSLQDTCFTSAGNEASNQFKPAVQRMKIANDSGRFSWSCMSFPTLWEVTIKFQCFSCSSPTKDGRFSDDSFSKNCFMLIKM